MSRTTLGGRNRSIYGELLPVLFQEHMCFRGKRVFSPPTDMLNQCRGRKQCQNGDPIQPAHPSASWNRAYSTADKHGCDVLRAITAATVLPIALSELVLEYDFQYTIRLGVQKDLESWPWTQATPRERLPLTGIDIRLSDTLSTVVVAYQGVLPCPRLMGIGVRPRMYLTFDGVPAHSEVELTLPNLHLQLGEALHGMGVTWRQLQKCVYTVFVKLKYNV